MDSDVGSVHLLNAIQEIYIFKYSSDEPQKYETFEYSLGEPQRERWGCPRRQHRSSYYHSVCVLHSHSSSFMDFQDVTTQRSNYSMMSHARFWATFIYKKIKFCNEILLVSKKLYTSSTVRTWKCRNYCCLSPSLSLDFVRLEVFNMFQQSVGASKHSMTSTVSELSF